MPSPVLIFTGILMPPDCRLLQALINCLESKILPETA